jgi:hypothetical protein
VKHSFRVQIARAVIQETSGDTLLCSAGVSLTQPTIQYISINYWAAVNDELEGMWKEGVVASFAVLAYPDS